VDVVKRFGHVLAEPPTDLYAPVVEAAAASGTAVEVSSAGLHKPVAELYPAPKFLEMFNAAGVAITLASDAHVPEECGRDVASVVEAARAAGYVEHLVFERRVASTKFMLD
jgi:histidinol-phosphatase (PHP family)